jgi:hypothetical protein
MKGKTTDLGLILLTVPLAVVVLISGCTTGDTTSVSFGNGVAITGWEPDFSSVDSEEPVSLQLKIQNTGRADAENVQAKIINVNLDEWGTGFSWTGDEKDFGTLLAPDEKTGTPGQTETYMWNLEAPELPEGMQFTYTPMVRVVYDYTTKAAKPITLVTTEELRRLVQNGMTLSGQTATYTEGPLSVEIRTGNFVKTGDIDQEFPIYILITDIGGGGVIPSSGMWGTGWGGWGTEDERYPVEMTLTLPDRMSLESEGSEYCSTSGETIELWGGNTAEITCKVSVDDPPDVREEALIQVELEYTYYTDSSTSIEVIGTGDSGWW